MKENKILRLDEYSLQETSCMSEKAKSLLERACKECLIKEAEDYDNDPHDSHTYEGYINKCTSYLEEMMGYPGYSDLYKHYKR